MKKEEERKMQIPMIHELEHTIEETRTRWGTPPGEEPILYLAWWKVPFEMRQRNPHLPNVCGKSARSPEAAYRELVRLTRLSGYAS